MHIFFLWFLSLQTVIECKFGIPLQIFVGWPELISFELKFHLYKRNRKKMIPNKKCIHLRAPWHVNLNISMLLMSCLFLHNLAKYHITTKSMSTQWIGIWLKVDRFIIHHETRWFGLLLQLSFYKTLSQILASYPKCKKEKWKLG